MADNIEPIAIVGMSCRFPSEARSVDGLWEMMTKAKKGHTKIPADRFNADTWYHPSHDRRGAVNTKHGFFLEDDISLFDAPFFSITAKEASGMDPMQRLLLEVSYETFENAGVPMDQLIGSKTSVFCGCFTGDYDLLSNHDIFDHAPNAATGTGRAMLSNRVSWFFDLRGSSFTLDTACSSSLYALHSACQSLRLGESKQALVTGSNLALYPSMFHSLTNMHFLSPDGICHSFDDRANGYARGEAIGGLLLKPLSAALADGDTIRAVIRGSATNQDGKTPGITMPSPESQADLIRFVYEQAGLKMSDTGFFEAHGTGTGLGDPMELSAIGSTLGAARETGQTPLYVGSIKSNIGHTEGCSGLAGVIKSVLCLEKGILVPNAGFENLNPKLRLKDWNLALPLTTMAWPTSGLRRASVNSFGYGGSNAHVILDDAYHYLKSRNLIGNHSTVVDNDFGSDSGISMSGSNTPPSEEDVDEAPVSGNNKLLVFSSLDQAGLQRQASSYRQALSKTEKNQKLSAQEYLDQQTYLDDLANTLAVRRTKFDYRSFTVVDSTGSLNNKLSKGLPKLKRASKDNNIMMVFTGQGAQWAQMGKELLDNPVFREATAKSQAYLEKFGATWNVFTELYKGEDSRIDSPEFSQPICTVLQISLIAVLRHWGITPKATVGHSSGEIGAAYAAGYVSHEDAIKVAYFRGVFSEDVANRLGNRKGIMMAAGVSEADALECLQKVTDGVAVVACINSPSSVTLSGDVSAISQLENMLTKDGKFARKLRVKTAYHSPHMQTIADDYLNAMGDIKPIKGNAGTVMYSSVSGKLALASDFNATYWVKNMVGSVRFSDAVSGLLVHSTSKSSRRKTPVKWSAAIEVGPHEALKGPVNQIMTSVDSKLSTNIMYTALVLRGKHAEVTALEAAGQLWCSGHSVDLAKVNGLDSQLATRKVLSDLPTYPWNHSKGFWFEPRMTTAKRFKKEPRTDLLGVPIDNQNDLEPHWRQILRIPENPWMEHHEITGTILYPGAGMLIMAIEAARQLADTTRSLKGIELRDVTFGRGLVIPSAEEAVETSLSLRPHKTFPHCFSWTLYSLPAGGSSWVENSSGLVALIYSDQPEVVDDINTEWQFQSSTYEAIKKASSTNINMEKFYKDLAAIGMGYGPSFRNLTESKAVPGTFRAHGVITIPDTKAIMPHQFEYPHLIHPATLDAIFHLLFAGFAQDEGMKESAVPVSMERMFISAECPQGAGTKYLGYTEGTAADGRDLAGDIVLSDDQWSEPKVVISISARKVTSSGSDSNGASSEETKRTATPYWKEDFSFMETSFVESFIRDKASTAFPDLEEESYAQLALWLDRACHKDADLRVLLVADTISADMREVLRKFGPEEDQILRFRQLTIAGKDEAAIGEMKELSVLSPLVKYQKIDFSAPVTEQNFAEGAFDLILVGTAPQAGVKTAASALKPLLAQNSNLIFTTTISNDVKDYAAWQAVYEETGFEKLALCLEHASTVLAVGSTGAKEESALQYSKVVFLKRDSVSAALEATMEKLASTLKAIGIETEITTLSAIEPVEDKAVISFLEAETPLVINWSSGELEQFKRLALNTPYLIWITRGGQMIDSEALEFAPATGMLRTIRTEVPQITLPHIDLSPTIDLAADSTADLIMKVFKSTARETAQTPEMEFVETRGKVMIPRVIENTSFDREIELHSKNVRPAMAPLHQSGRPLKLEIGSSGSRWVEDEEASSDLACEDVEIKMSAVCLSSLDIRAISEGSGAVVGRQGTGVIARFGSAVTRFTVGQEVAVLKAHSYRTHLRQDQAFVQALPAKFSAVEVAALPTTYSAAYYALAEIARVSSTDKVLIQAGSSSLGHAAVQIAKWKGAEIFVNADPASTQTLKDFGIPADHIFDERSDYKVQLQHAAGGLDVIFSSTSGKALRDLCALVNPFGRFVNISSNAEAEQLSTKLFTRNVSFTNIDLEHLFNSSLMSKLQENVFKLLDIGAIGSIPSTSYSVSQMQEVLSTAEFAHEATVLRLDQDAVVPTTPPAPPALKLDPEATYMLSGGLGGLGPNIASTMYEAGARHLVFLSRSGARTPEQKAVLKKLEANGCKADALACDVSDVNDMQKAMDTAARNDWKIKGVIQCAMVLRDSVLENMTYDKWVGATTCKIPGTWNLHAFLPEDMDFFIVLSSVVSVIGNTGQANYSAGNSYLDALAHYRHGKGLAATSLNIGLVTDATHFTEDFTIENFLQLYGHLVPVSVEDKEVNIALTAAMRGVTSDGVKVPTQVVVGIRGDLDREGTVTSLWPKDRKFDHRAKDKGTAGGDGKVQLKTILANAKSIAEAAEAVESALRSNVASSMGSSPDEVDVEKPLHSFGIDSLKAVEVRNWLFREAKADISVFEILSPTPLNVLSMKIAAKSKFLPAEITKQAAEELQE